MVACTVKNCRVRSGGKVYRDGETVELSSIDAALLQNAGSVVIDYPIEIVINNKIPSESTEPVEEDKKEDAEITAKPEPKRKKGRRSKK